MSLVFSSARSSEKETTANRFDIGRACCQLGHSSHGNDNPRHAAGEVAIAKLVHTRGRAKGLPDGLAQLLQRDGADQRRLALRRSPNTKALVEFLGCLLASRHRIRRASARRRTRGRASVRKAALARHATRIGRKRTVRFITLFSRFSDFDGDAEFVVQSAAEAQRLRPRLEQCAVILLR